MSAPVSFSLFCDACCADGSISFLRFSLRPAPITIFVGFPLGRSQCIGQNYAYNEASYFLVRLLQNFSTFKLAPDAQPSPSLPPAEWKAGRGRMAVEQVRPEAAMTLFIKVSRFHFRLL